MSRRVSEKGAIFGDQRSERARGGTPTLHCGDALKAECAGKHTLWMWIGVRQSPRAAPKALEAGRWHLAFQRKAQAFEEGTGAARGGFVPARGSGWSPSG